MNRGHRSLFIQLFDEPIQAIPTGERKGRSEVLIARRNELLVCRYYYYAKIQEKKYNYILAQLELETNIAQRTISDTLTSERPLLLKLRETSPPVEYFKNKYPWLIWRKTAD